VALEMNESVHPVGGAPGRDLGAWAKPMSRLHVETLPVGAINLNVEGRRLVGPLQGFGQMWQKTFAVRLIGVDVTPTELIRVWKAHFSEFWPKGNTFYAPLAGIAPGEIAVLMLSPQGPAPRLSTGVRVIYADDESFTFMAPEGHVLAGWITFRAFRDADGTTVAQAQALERTSDPIYEVAAVLGFHAVNNRFWQATLCNLAAHFGVQAEVDTQAVCVDRRLQWSKVTNVWQNAALRTVLYACAGPLRWVRALATR
jgi:hypothetical protein